MQLLRDQLAHVWVAEEVVHHVLPLLNLAHVLEREQQPAMQHAGTHRGDGLVDDVEQRDAVLVHRGEQLQVADGELVEAYEAVLLDAAQGGDVSQLEVLCHLHILHDGPGSHDAVLQVVHAKALQVLHLKVFQELLSRSVLGEHPVVQLKGDKA